VHRWARDARVDGFTVAIVVAFVVLRLVATLGSPVAVFNDSPSYFDFRIWGGVRFPVVTAAYSLVGDHRAIVDVQAVVGAISWSVAAVLAGSVLPQRIARSGFQVAVLALGLTPPVTRFDNALLSESISISITVVLVAAVLRFACYPTTRMAVTLFALAVLWGFTRQSNAIVLVAAGLVMAALGGSRADRHIAWRLAVGLIAVAVVGVLLASSTSQVQEYNSAQILVRRVLSDDARERWFLDRGMPSNGDRLLVPPYANRFGDPAVELQEDPTFGPWLRDDFPRRYLQYVLTHPVFTITTPFGDDGALTPLAVGTAQYGRARAVLPGVAGSVFWPSTTWERRLAGIAALAILGAGAAAAVRSRPRRRALAGAGGVVLVALANLVLVTHAAGWEYERLLVPTGVAVRVALVWLLAALVGGVSVAPASAPPARALRRRDVPSSDAAADPGPRTPHASDGSDSSAAIEAGRAPGRSGTAPAPSRSSGAVRMHRWRTMLPRTSPID